jgi:hypothetical protein
MGLNSWSCSTRRRQRVLLVEPPSPYLPAFLEPGDLDHQVLALRQELVQRRIDRTNRHRRAVHRLEHAVEVLALHRQELVQRLATICFVVARIMRLHDRNATFAKEHVLCAAQADAARAELVGGLGLVGWSALARMPSRRYLSAQVSSFSKR